MWTGALPRLLYITRVSRARAHSSRRHHHENSGQPSQSPLLVSAVPIHLQTALTLLACVFALLVCPSSGAPSPAPAPAPVNLETLLLAKLLLLKGYLLGNYAAEQNQQQA